MIRSALITTGCVLFCSSVPALAEHDHEDAAAEPATSAATDAAQSDAEDALVPKPDHPGADPALSDAEQIMLYERNIYTRRGQGDMSYYHSLTHPNYMGWPPMMKAPIVTDGLTKEMAEASRTRLLGEKIDFYPMDVAIAGDLAMAYFVGHRIVMGGTLEPSNEYFDNIHVWKKGEDGLWYLMGGMARPMPPETREYLLEE